MELLNVCPSKYLLCTLRSINAIASNKKCSTLVINYLMDARASRWSNNWHRENIIQSRKAGREANSTIIVLYIDTALVRTYKGNAVNGKSAHTFVTLKRIVDDCEIVVLRSRSFTS